MNPVTHFLTGWVVAHMVELSPRERLMVSLASVVPDVDALGLVAEVLTRHSSHPLEWWSRYHHVLGHNVGLALGVALIVFGLARRRWATAGLSLLSFHLHLLGDLVGARGPDGEQWPIPYLLPFSGAWELTWTRQWPLNAWPNLVITAVLLAVTLHLARQRGYSPLGLISAPADRVFVATLRRRFPLRPPGPVAGGNEPPASPRTADPPDK